MQQTLETLPVVVVRSLPATSFPPLPAMLADVTNHTRTAPSSAPYHQSLRVETNVNNKRWVGEDGDLLPSKLRAKRRFGEYLPSDTVEDWLTC